MSYIPSDWISSKVSPTRLIRMHRGGGAYQLPPTPPPGILPGTGNLVRNSVQFHRHAESAWRRPRSVRPLLSRSPCRLSPRLISTQLPPALRFPFLFFLPHWPSTLSRKRHISVPLDGCPPAFDPSATLHGHELVRSISLIPSGSTRY